MTIMPICFSQKSWPFIKEHVMNYVLHYFNTNKLPENINKTNTILISNTSNTKYIKDFRPISLFNMIYEIMKKIIVLWL